MMINDMINLGTMFTGGLSGIDFAFKYENIKYKHIFGAEWDKFARRQFVELHGKPDEFYYDVSKFNGSKYKNKIDLLVWGSSCQNFSLAGNRKGLDGDASKYFIDGLKRQKEIMPKTFIFENVKGMLSANNGNDFKFALQAFRDIGYSVTYKVLNAKDYGTPQNRERVFVVGFLDENDYYSFSFENKKPLEKCLKDYLEDDVDEKYFLSEKLLAGFKRHKNRHRQRGNGFAFDPKLSSETKYINCLSTRYGTRNTDTYLKQENKIRKFTPRECFRLMGVKDEDIKLINSHTQSYKISGNGIEVNTMRSIVRALYINKFKNNLFDFKENQ